MAEMFVVLVALLGFGVGSFLSVVVSRGKKLFAKKRSFCDACKRTLFWWENIPLLSFSFLRGKCRTCRSPIPFWFPLVELITGLSFLFTYLTWKTNFFVFGFSSLAVLFLWLIIAVIDCRKMIIPDWSVISLLVLTILIEFLTFSSFPALGNKLLGALVAFGFLLFLHLITKGKGMGLGDVKLAIFIGLFLGFSKAVLALYLAILTGAVWGVIMIMLKKARFKQQVPFGPFLVLGTFISWWWGNNILFWLTQWLGF